MNIYYDPKAFGLSIFGEIEYSSGAYEFDTLVIWEDERGGLWWAHDSGCSCPTPFEDESRNTILPIRTAEDAAKAFAHDGYVGSPSAMTEAMDLLARVLDHLRAAKKSHLGKGGVSV